VLDEPPEVEVPDEPPEVTAAPPDVEPPDVEVTVPEVTEVTVVTPEPPDV